MTEVTIRELPNHGGEVVSGAAQGEQITITRAGKPVAELRPVSRDLGAALFEQVRPSTDHDRCTSRLSSSSGPSWRRNRTRVPLAHDGSFPGWARA
jgi:prevent-host-death family protein